MTMEADPAVAGAAIVMVLVKLELDASNVTEPTEITPVALTTVKEKGPRVPTNVRGMASAALTVALWAVTALIEGRE